MKTEKQAHSACERHGNVLDGALQVLPERQVLHPMQQQRLNARVSRDGVKLNLEGYMGTPGSLVRVQRRERNLLGVEGPNSTVLDLGQRRRNGTNRHELVQ